MKLFITCFLISLCIIIFCAYNCDSVVPKLVKYHNTGVYYNLVESITFIHSYTCCYILTDALKRFEQSLTLLKQYLKIPANLSNNTIHTILISISSGCDESNGELWPTELMNETYSIIVFNEKIILQSKEIWGTLHGLETLLQLVYRSSLDTKIIEGGVILDEPLYQHRGFLIDTSRHYLSIDEIKKFIDAMSMVKMNVLHWHIVDDQSFPYVSKTFPKLSLKGAFHPNILIYTPSDVEDLVNYARLRGIRIMPEFDTPGHVDSWGKGYPEVLTKCYIKGEPDGSLGPINPTTNVSYNFITQLYTELLTVFPDNWFHLGGDEVSYDCWRSNPSINEFMKQMEFGDDYHRLEGYYINRLIKIINDIKPSKRQITPVVWQEIFQNGFRGDKSTIIHVWKDLDWQSVVKNITKTGYKVLFSAAWYLNYISYGDDWKNYYHVNPRDFGGTKEDAKLVIGGEAAMWGEYVDDTNLFSRSWPRGSAVAERLWTDEAPNMTDFIPRVEELRCRMLSRGWNAEPINGPGFCPL
ncbi:Beta-hexosaminidase subunit beta [Schistosoma japonicum]|nr:Beta-hexosaminidase subunit beta [Schistosoma japonicum]